MPLKHKIYWCILIVVGLVFMELFSQPDSLLLFDEVVEQCKRDEEMMALIGGYKNYEYEYNSNQLEEDTLDFLITVYGQTGKLMLEGEAVKKNDAWLLGRHTSEVMDY